MNEPRPVKQIDGRERNMWKSRWTRGAGIVDCLQQADSMQEAFGRESFCEASGQAMASVGRVHFLVVRGEQPPAQSLIEALSRVGEVKIIDALMAASNLACGPTPVHPVLITPDAWPYLPGIVRGSSDLEHALDAVGRAVARLGLTGAPDWASTTYRSLPLDVRSQIEEEARNILKILAPTATRSDNAATLAPRKRIITHELSGRRFEAAFVPILGAGNTGASMLSGAVVMLRDITRDLDIQRRIDAIDRAGRELLRLDPEEVRKLDAADRLRILQERIARAAHDLLSFDHFTIRLLDAQSGRLEPVIAVGVPQYALEAELYAHREGSGLSGYVAATGRGVVCADVTKDERYVRGLDSPGSSLTAPLLINDRVIGVLNVESDAPRAFDDNDLRFAEIFARYIALSLHILDLLVVERSVTNERVSGRVEGEISEPLDNLAREAAWLRDNVDAKAETPAHVERILTDINAIRHRMGAVAQGPRSLLGANLALQESKIDPIMAGQRILVVDDESQIRSQIADVLSRRGADVTTVANGDEAIKLIERQDSESASDAAGFRLVISDIRLPDRNGYEVFSAAKRADKTTPVVLMTGFGYDPHHSVMRASQEGLHAVLFKPFHVERLVEVVQESLAGAPEHPDN